MMVVALCNTHSINLCYSEGAVVWWCWPLYHPLTAVVLIRPSNFFYLLYHAVELPVKADIISCTFC